MESKSGNKRRFISTINSVVPEKTKDKIEDVVLLIQLSRELIQNTKKIATGV